MTWPAPGTEGNSYETKSPMANFLIFGMVWVVGITTQNFKIGLLQDISSGRKWGEFPRFWEVLCFDMCFQISVLVIGSAVSETFLLNKKIQRNCVGINLICSEYTENVGV